MACPACGSEAPAGARFCASCGRPLHSPDDERRVVTVLFADIVGFTSLSERLDPEFVKNLVDRCFTRLAQDVTAFGGRVDKIVDNLGVVKPTFMGAAPRIFEKAYARIITMQAAEGVPIEIVSVVQSLIVLFIAAPPLIRAIFHLPAPDAAPRKRRGRAATKATAAGEGTGK